MARDRWRQDHSHAGSGRRLIRRLVRSWRHRVAVAGHSMEPNLRDGDWLLVDPDAFMRRSPSVGELVVARDPREAGRLIVKRVSSVEAGGGPVVGGDHPAHADELISVSVADLCGRPWFRYWPLRRFGRLS